MYHTAVCIVRRYQRSSLFLEVVEDTAITHHNCKTTTSTPVSIAALRNMFAHYGIPEQLVSENGSQFLSEEVHQFPAANSVKHICYHPPTNGAGKRLIKLLNMHQNQDISVEFHWSRLGQLFNTTCHYRSYARLTLPWTLSTHSPELTQARCWCMGPTAAGQ